MGLATCVVLIALLSACAPLAHAFKHYAHGQTCLIFSGIDSNGDGRIDSAERGKAIGAAAAPSSSARAGAASPPLSAQELCQNWGRVCSHMTVDDVVAWVSHSVLLPPPVAEQFRLHSIGGCDLDDFNDGVLANEIGIAAPLHRKKIINAIRMKLFGQHDEPATPVGLRADSLRCDAVRVTWDAAADAEHRSTGAHARQTKGSNAAAAVAPVHRYLLQRRAVVSLSAPGGSNRSSALDFSTSATVENYSDLDDLDWRTVYANASASVTDMVDSAASVRYEYRVRAWNTVGASQYSAPVEIHVAACEAAAPASLFEGQPHSLAAVAVALLVVAATALRRCCGASGPSAAAIADAVALANLGRAQRVADIRFRAAAAVERARATALRVGLAAEASRQDTSKRANLAQDGAVRVLKLAVRTAHHRIRDSSLRLIEARRRATRETERARAAVARTAANVAACAAAVRQRTVAATESDAAHRARCVEAARDRARVQLETDVVFGELAAALRMSGRADGGKTTRLESALIAAYRVLSARRLERPTELIDRCRPTVDALAAAGRGLCRVCFRVPFLSSSLHRCSDCLLPFCENAACGTLDHALFDALPCTVNGGCRCRVCGDLKERAMNRRAGSHGK